MSPNSIHTIEELLPIIYPGVTRSFGSVQPLLIEAQVLASVDLACGYLPYIVLCKSRSSEDWEVVLIEPNHRGMDLEIIVKDTASFDVLLKPNQLIIICRYIDNQE